MDGDSDSDAALIDLPSTGGGTVTQFAGPRPRNGRPGPSLRPAEARTTGSHRAGGLTPVCQFQWLPRNVARQ
jgi:hypothetical protein